MNCHRLLFLGLDEASCAVAEQTARRIFPEITVSRVGTLDAARGNDLAADVEFLLLEEPEDQVLTEAVTALDSRGLPRWAVIVRGDPGRAGLFEAVPPADWDEGHLLRVFGSAPARHLIRREHARMAGDLETIARRVCHDLRTPLGGILSVGEALKEVLAEHAPDSVPLTKGITQSVDELDRLIGRVSLLLKASIAPPATERVPLDGIIARVLLRLEHKIRAQGIAVKEPAVWPEVHGVPLLLETVWWNLMNNALQHGKGATRVELGWTREDSQFRFWVADNGCGVSPDRLRTLIQPFHLLHHANASNGLGLPTVQRLVEQHGGSLGCEPASDRGVRFHLTLPVPPETVGTPVPDPRLV